MDRRSRNIQRRILQGLAMGYAFWSFWELGKASFGVGQGLMTWATLLLVDRVDALISVLGRRIEDLKHD